MQSQSTITVSPEAFQFTLTDPYSSLENGIAKSVPYVVSGLLTQGGLSVLGAKPKQGKSSIARHLAVCVSKGAPFLGRDTTQGDVIIINLEDPTYHVANHLIAMGHDPIKDGKIRVIEDLSPVKQDNMDALRKVLTQSASIRLVVIDHLAKLLRISDMHDYVKVQEGFEKLHSMSREFPHLHILALVHCKKVTTDDPFDQILGSTALRGEPDTNIVIFQDNGNRVITSETRIGRAIPATLLLAETVDVGDSTLVKDFSLGSDYEQIKAEAADKKRKRRETSYTDRIYAYLAGCPDHTASLKEVKANVEGKAESIVEAIEVLQDQGVLTVTEGKGKGSPKTIKMDLTTTSGSLYAISQGKGNSK